MTSFCAAVVVRNEALFLRESLLSIAGVFEEISVVDHGSVDETVEILEALESQVPELRVHQAPPGSSLSKCRNHVAETSRCEWIWNWDADFIAYETGTPRGMDAQRSAVEDLAKSNVNLILLGAPNCGPTPETTIRGREIAGMNGDIKVVKREIYTFKTGKYADEFATDPARLRRAYLNKGNWIAHFIHLEKMKLPERLVLRDLMISHDRGFHSGKSSNTFEQWLRERGLPNKLDAHIERLLADLGATAVPYDFERWGAHPPLLVSALDKAPMRFRDKGGRQMLEATEVANEFPMLRQWIADLR